MNTLKALRNRKKVVESIERMTTAMKMVAQAKLYKNQQRLKTLKVVQEEIVLLLKKVLGKKHVDFLLHHEGETEERFQQWFPLGNKDAPNLLVVITSEGSMCGGFNQKLVKYVRGFLETHPKTHMVVVGKSFPPLESLSTRYVTHSFVKDTVWLTHLAEEFRDGKWKECWIAYNQCKNILNQEPHGLQFLPFHLEAFGTPPAPEHSYTLETDAESFFPVALSLLLETTFKRLHVEHFTSEYSARMAAMDTARENAKRTLKQLTLTYHHIRQSMITKELIEIMAGVEALREGI